MTESKRELSSKGVRSNVFRDERDIKALHALGWRKIVVWERKLMGLPALEARLELELT